MDCHGSGYIASRKKIQVSIPAGIDNGQSVRIRDKGWQVSGLVPGFAPVPRQVLHSSFKVSSISFSTPKTASSKVILTLVLISIRTQMMPP